MTTDERARRWQQIFDDYDRAMARYAAHTTLTEQLAPLLAQFIARADAQATAARGMAEATMTANRAALALYRDEHEQEG